MRSAVAFGVLAALTAGSLLALPCGPCCAPEQRPVSFVVADCCGAASASGCPTQLKNAAPRAGNLPAAAGAPATLEENVADPPRPAFALAAASALPPVSLAGFRGFIRPLLV